MKKIFFTITILLLLFLVLSGCNEKIENRKVEQTSPLLTQKVTQSPAVNSNLTTNPGLKSIHPAITTKKNKINYIGLDNCLLGTCENGKWNSIQSNQDLKVNNIRAISFDEIYHSGTYRGYSFTAKIKDITEFYDKNQDTQNDLKYFRFNSPENIKLVMTGTWNAIPRKITTEIKPTTEDKNIIKNILVSSGLTKVSVKIDNITNVDVDNDGKPEEFIVANSYSKSDNNFTDFKLHNSEKPAIPDGMGVYSIIVMKKDNRIIPLVNEVLKSGKHRYIDYFFESELLGIYDLNGDGTMELCVKNIHWDVPKISVFELKNSEFKCVLYGNFAW